MSGEEITINNPYYPYGTLDVIHWRDLAGFTDDVCNWNLKITPTNCITTDVQEIYFKVNWLPPELRETVEEEPDGYGKTRIKTRLVRTFLVFNTWCDPEMRYYINQLIRGSYDLELTNGTNTIEVSNAELEEEYFEDANVFRITIKVESNEDDLATNPFGVISCCRPLYVEAPYDDGCPPCDDPGGEGEEPYDCDLITFSVTRSGDDLVANVGGDPPVPYTIQWLYRPNANAPWQILISNATSIALGAYGEYRANLNVVGCPQRNDSYLYTNPCTGITVSAIQVADSLFFSVDGNCNDPVYSVEYNDAGTWEARTHDGSNTYFPIAGENGLYRITVTCDNECERQTVVSYQYTAPEDCPDVDIEIIRSGNTLLAVVTGNYVGIPTYQWYLDTGGGFNPMGVDPLQGIFVTAYYWVRVTVDGCTYDQYKFVSLAEDCEPCLLSVEITRDGDVLTANLFNCDDEEPEINWFVNYGPGYIPLGSGNTVPVSFAGLYKVVVKCGDCEARDYYLNIVCDPCEDFEVTIEKINGEGLGTWEAQFECDGDAIITWKRIDEDGIEILNNNTPLITPSKIALYEVEVNCNGCIATARFVACELEAPLCVCYETIGNTSLNRITDVRLPNDYSLRIEEPGSFNFPYLVPDISNLIDDLNAWYADKAGECCPEWELIQDGAIYYIRIKCIQSNSEYMPFVFIWQGNVFTYFEESTPCEDCCDEPEPCMMHNYVAEMDGSDNSNLIEFSFVGGLNLSPLPAFNFPYDFSNPTQRDAFALDFFNYFSDSLGYESCPCEDGLFPITYYPLIEDLGGGQYRFTLTCWRDEYPEPLTWDMVESGGGFTKTASTEEDNCCQFA